MKPIRTALFAPGIKERVMTKALESGADAVICDLEDAVTPVTRPPSPTNSPTACGPSSSWPASTASP